MNATIKKSGNFLRKIKGGEDMKLRWRRGIAALLTAVVLLSMPGGLELTAAATETVQETVSKRNSEYDLVMDTSGQMIVGYTGEPVDLVIPEGTCLLVTERFRIVLLWHLSNFRIVLKRSESKRLPDAPPCHP